MTREQIEQLEKLRWDFVDLVADSSHLTPASQFAAAMVTKHLSMLLSDLRGTKPS